MRIYINSNQIRFFALEVFGGGFADVGEANGEGVGGVGIGGFAEAEKGAHHEDDLRFVGGPFADDGLFDAAWRVFADFETGLGGGDECGTARGTHGDGGFVGLDVDDAFHRAFRGGVGFDDGSQLFGDGEEARGLAEFWRIADGAIDEGDGIAHAFGEFENGEPGVSQGRVDS